MSRERPIIVGIGGFTSDVGKTTLLCELLRAFPGWEAIKTTRGHYRSCGKDPHACCVSHLLSDEPVIRSGRDETYTEGKDTGRYWDAGASDVHWLIATEQQIDSGIKSALSRVRAPGVFVEGNSFSEFVETDAFIMSLRKDGTKIKSTAIRALGKATALYSWQDVASSSDLDLINDRALQQHALALPRYSEETLRDLVSALAALKRSLAASVLSASF